MKSRRILLLTLLGALGRVTAMAQTNVYSVHAIGGGESALLFQKAKAAGKPITIIECPLIKSPDPMPNFQEVFQILRNNLEGANSNELNSAAVQGLIHELGPRVSLVPAQESASKTAPLAESRVFGNSFAYFRVAAVSSNLPAAFRADYSQMNETNKTKIKGLILDLRFADGFDYEAAAKVADCFLNSDHLLLDWQSGSAHATLKADALTMPVAILINSQTVGAAEALAALLRDNDVGLILGGPSAGQASVYKDFPLGEGTNAAKLRVAVAQVKFAAGKTLAAGLTPDIAINTSLEDERAYLEDPFKVLHPPASAKSGETAQQLPEQPRMNEVELIREHNSGEDRPEAPQRRPADLAEPAPVVADPVLSRALDLLKGLAVVEPNRPG